MADPATDAPPNPTPRAQPRSATSKADEAGSSGGKSRSGAGSRPPAASDEGMKKVVPPQIPPRPKLESDGDLAQSFTAARQQLDGVLGEQNRRVTELQLATSQGFEQAMRRLEESARFTRSLLERNETLAREAERLRIEGQQLAGQQDELENRVRRAADQNQQITDRFNTLHAERARMESEAATLEEALRAETDRHANGRANLERLQARREKLVEENTELERSLARLDETVARLERVREEYLTAVKRARKTVNELTKEPEDAK